MKKTIYLITITSLLSYFTSCSSDENTMDTNSGGINEPKVEKFVKQITDLTAQQSYPNSYSPDIFTYSDNKLIKYYAHHCSGTLYKMIYGNNGKMEKVYGKDFGLPMYIDESTVIKPENLKETFVYDTNNKLIKFDRNTIEYDANNRIIKIIQNSSSGVVTEVKFRDFDANGNAQTMDKNGVISKITYDNKVNPKYVLFKKYGFFHIETCNSFDEDSVRLEGYISPNNIVEIKENGKLIYEATYVYDNDNYPAQIRYTIYDGSNKRTIVDKYIY